MPTYMHKIHPALKEVGVTILWLFLPCSRSKIIVYPCSLSGAIFYLRIL
jgi:hypothetical protein